MHAASTSSTTRSWRGSATIWTRSGHARSRQQSIWPWGALCVDGENFAIHAAGARMDFTAAEVVRVWAHERPFPTLVVLMKMQNHFEVGVFMVLGRQRLEEILARIGLEPVRKRWLMCSESYADSGLQALQDGLP